MSSVSNRHTFQTSAQQPPIHKCHIGIILSLSLKSPSPYQINLSGNSLLLPPLCSHRPTSIDILLIFPSFPFIQHRPTILHPTTVEQQGSATSPVSYGPCRTRESDISKLSNQIKLLGERVDFAWRGTLLVKSQILRNQCQSTVLLFIATTIFNLRTSINQFIKAGLAPALDGHVGSTPPTTQYNNELQYRRSPFLLYA